MAGPLVAIVPALAWPALVLIAGSLAPGCRSHAPVVQDLGDHPWSSQLVNGRATKQDVVLLLGIPAALYEQEAILTYHLAADDAAGTRIARPRPDPHDQPLASWHGRRFDLILVFDRNDVLQRHSLVKVY